MKKLDFANAPQALVVIHVKERVVLMIAQVMVFA